MNKTRILQLLADAIEIEETDIYAMEKDEKLLNMGLDSIRFIRFIVALEEEFNIEILDSDIIITKFETIDELLDILSKYFDNNGNICKKVLICDCDNVLWEGISGEESIQVKNNHILFQSNLIELYHKGVLICLCSRNEPDNISEAFSSLHMPLKPEYILTSKINMNDKASNIKSISEELNLSLDSFVFIDDSDYEIGLIKFMLPDVTTLKADFNDDSFLEKVKSFFPYVATSSDRNRTKQYREQKEREKEKFHFSTIDQYNFSLKTTVICNSAKPEHAMRIAELSQRTHQFNLSGNVYDENDIIRFISKDYYDVIYISVSDIYGDMGIVGAAIIRLTNDLSIIESFFLSCRSFGRGFEDIMIGKIKSISNKTLCGIYCPTEKNKNYKDFYHKNGVEFYDL